MLEGMQELAARYTREGVLHDATMVEYEAAADKGAFARALAARLHVGPLRTNGARCLGCGDEIHSLHRHDFRTCTCGAVSVDGGTWYARRAFRGDVGWDNLVERWPWAGAA